jgi:hypothetical protein
MQKKQVSEPLSKRACLLEPNQISELIMDSDSDQPLCDVVAIKDEEYCEKVLLEPHLRSMSEYAACSNIQAPLCRIQLVPLKKPMMFRAGQIHIHNSHQTRVETALPSEGPRRKNDSEVPHIDDRSTLRSVFTL